MWKKIKMMALAAVVAVVSISVPVMPEVPETVKAAETYMIYFDSMGGSEVQPILNLSYNSYVTSLPTPVKEGFIFEGWYTDPNYTTRFYGYTHITDNMILFAKWQEKTAWYLEVSYTDKTAVADTLLDLKKLKVVATYSDGSKKLLDSSEYQIDDMMVKLGYNIFTITSGFAAASFYIEGVKAPEYTVAFYSNGGTYVPPISGIKENETISLPAQPGKTNYEFKGWYLDNNTFKNEFTSETKITKNLIVFAKWEKLEVIEEKTVYELNTEDMVLRINEQGCVFIESFEEYLEAEYVSDNESIATVTEDGIVEGIRPGTTSIFVITPEGDMLECAVFVKGTVAKSIKLNASSKALKKGKTFQIKTTFSPSNVSSKKLKYTSSNKNIAKVSSSGKITAVKKGTCYITVATTDGSRIKKKIKIKVA